MLREEVLRKWKNYKEKVKAVINEYDYELLNYRGCFIIATTESSKPKWHKKERMLINGRMPCRVISDHDVQTGLIKVIKPELTYSYDEREYLSNSAIILLPN